jgi:hypothetical protein
MRKLDANENHGYNIARDSKRYTRMRWQKLAHHGAK